VSAQIAVTADQSSVLESTATIEQAYASLTPPEFSLWVRMMVIPPQELNAGRQALSHTVRLTRSWTDKLTEGLQQKGFIELVPSKCGQPKAIRIVRRLALIGHDRVVRLSRNWPNATWIEVLQKLRMNAAENRGDNSKIKRTSERNQQ